MKTKRINMWALLVTHINSFSPGELIRRNDILKVCDKIDERSTSNSVDTYRRILTRLGYLVSFDRGLYRVVKKIPPISLREAISKANSLRV